MGAMRTLAMLAVLLCACAPAAEAAGCTSQMMLQFSRASQEYAACIQRKPADVMGAGSSFCKCASAYVSGLRELAQHCVPSR